MADQVPANVVSLLKDLVGAVVMQQAQIAELQGDRATLQADVAALQAHAETLVGDTGLTTQLGDLTTVPALHEQLAAALPVPADAPAPAAAAPVPAPEPANTAEPQAAAA
jgi:hypothetical protein